MLELMSRKSKYRNPKSLTNIYKSLVRPHLDHCSTVWNPHYKKDKLTYCYKRYSIVSRVFPHEKVCRMKDLICWLWSLQERCNRADMIGIFKMVRGFTSTSWTFVFHSAEDKITRGHSWKLGV